MKHCVRFFVTLLALVLGFSTQAVAQGAYTLSEKPLTADQVEVGMKVVLRTMNASYQSFFNGAKSNSELDQSYIFEVCPASPIDAMMSFGRPLVSLKRVDTGKHYLYSDETGLTTAISSLEIVEHPKAKELAANASQTAEEARNMAKYLIALQNVEGGYLNMAEPNNMNTLYTWNSKDEGFSTFFVYEVSTTSGLSNLTTEELIEAMKIVLKDQKDTTEVLTQEMASLNAKIDALQATDAKAYQKYIAGLTDVARRVVTLSPTITRLQGTFGKYTAETANEEIIEGLYALNSLRVRVYDAKRLLREFKVTVDNYKPGANDDQYPVNWDKKTNLTNKHAGRKVMGLRCIGSEGETSIDIDTSNVYADLSDTQSFTVQAESEVAIMAKYSGVWMHGYVYVDENEDGQFKWDDVEAGEPGSELVSYSFYGKDSGFNSVGEELSGGALNTVSGGYILTPPFIAPSKPGNYRLRYKIDWNNIDPAGQYGEKYSDNFIDVNGGAIIDITLKVVPATAPSAPAKPLGIHEASQGAKSAATYDLAGRRVNQKIKGHLYIENGRKIIAQ